MWTLTYGLTQANLMFAFRESNTPGKVIVALLFIGSIFAWSIMITKLRVLRRARRDSIVFLRSYRSAADRPLRMYQDGDSLESSPLYAIYASACDVIGDELDGLDGDARSIFLPGDGHVPHPATSFKLRRMKNAAERTMADQALRLDSDMGILATAVSAAPFLGLLGTVWGVMGAFSGMAVTGSPTMDAVAPGISGALLTTVVGLLVALPSAIGYNTLSSTIRHLCVAMESFCEEMLSDLEVYVT
ncbi:MAG: MotA/TolQ/ExbB proton channel family protein [Verrucomicrobia bacterium]|nr:MotA/TolQ/ExbB proton channel family protein [Verrucomicrobiota bacterium]